MSTLPGLLWCGAHAPIVEGFLVGLGIATAGLVFFPFVFSVTRPNSGRQSTYAKAARAMRWARPVSWLLAVLSTATIVGYVVIFVRAEGKYCDATLSPVTERLIVWWSVVAAVTAAMVAVSIGLRWRARSSHE